MGDRIAGRLDGKTDRGERRFRVFNVCRAGCRPFLTAEGMAALDDLATFVGVDGWRRGEQGRTDRAASTSRRRSPVKPVDHRPSLDRAAALAFDWLESLDDRPVGPPVDAATLLARAPVTDLPDEASPPTSPSRSWPHGWSPDCRHSDRGGTSPWSTAAPSRPGSVPTGSSRRGTNTPRLSSTDRRRSPLNRLPVAGSSTCWIFPETPPWGSRRCPGGEHDRAARGPPSCSGCARHQCRTNRARRGPPVALIGSAEQPPRSPDRPADRARLDAIVPVPSDSSGAMDPDAARAAILGHAGPLIVRAGRQRERRCLRPDRCHRRCRR